MESPALQTFSTRLTEDLIHDVKVCSAQHRIPVQWIVAQALRQWLDDACATDRAAKTWPA